MYQETNVRIVRSIVGRSPWSLPNPLGHRRDGMCVINLTMKYFAPQWLHVDTCSMGKISKQRLRTSFDCEFSTCIQVK